MSRDNNNSTGNIVNSRYIYGPVPSRRLGLSLGVDIIPCKLCSFDCAYCQLGRTTRLCSRRQHTVRMDRFLAEIRDAARRIRSLDCVSIAGSGEPTLSSDLADCCQVIRKYFKQPLVLITNASLLWRPSVIRDIRYTDILIPSLDAVSPGIFKILNKPVSGIQIGKIIRGLVTLREKYAGKIYLEVMLVKDLNDTVSEMKKVARVARQIRPDKVQLNLPTRVSSAKNMMPNAARIKVIEDIFRKESTPVEVVGKFTGAAALTKGSSFHIKDQLVSMMKRRPATIEDMTAVAKVDTATVRSILEEISKIHSLRCANGYYSII